MKTSGRPPFVHRDFKPLVKAALARGWILGKTGKGHPRLCPPEGWTRPDGERANPITLPSTPSDHRGLKNTIRDLRRMGLDV